MRSLASSHVGVAVDAVRLAYARCMLAAACLAAIFCDPAGGARFEDLAPASALAYLAWAISVVLTASRGRALSTQWLCWIDVAFSSWLVWLADTADSVFFVCYLFPIITASLSYGLRYGLAVTFACAAMLLALGTMAMPGAGELIEARVFVRPAYLAIFGSLTACWGGRELRVKRELELLHLLGQPPNFRRASEATISEALDRLREFHRAHHAFLVMEREAPRAVYSSGLSAHPVTPLTEAAREMLLGAPDMLAIAYRRTREAHALAAASAFDVRDGARAAAPVEWCARVAGFLEARAFVCVPYAERGGNRGRLYVTSGRAFSSGDVEFGIRFSSMLAGLVDHARVVDELASTAVERERSRISLDIHDTTIQPYIGLRMGLEALLAEAEEDGDVKGTLRDLVEMADLSVRDLRAYAAGLRAGPRSDGMLLAAVMEQAERYARFYDVQVDVAIDKAGLPADIAAEVFQIISEGLSNVRRHTDASRASIRLRYEDRTLRVEIRNETSGPAARAFTPRSIQQRAAMLGGTVSIAAGEGETVVSVSVPL